MTDLLKLSELPFPTTTPSHAGVWRRDEHSTALVGTAPATPISTSTPAGRTPPMPSRMLNAVTLLGLAAAR